MSISFAIPAPVLAFMKNLNANKKRDVEFEVGLKSDEKDCENLDKVVIILTATEEPVNANHAPAPAAPAASKRPATNDDEAENNAKKRKTAAASEDEPKWNRRRPQCSVIISDPTSPLFGKRCRCPAPMNETLCGRHNKDNRVVLPENQCTHIVHRKGVAPHQCKKAKQKGETLCCTHFELAKKAASAATSAPFPSTQENIDNKADIINEDDEDEDEENEEDEDAKQEGEDKKVAIEA